MLHNITPFNDHLQVRILDGPESLVEDWKDSCLNCKVLNLKGIPVVACFFSHHNLNCFVHINFPDLIEWGTAHWLISEDRLKMTFCLYDMQADLILDVKPVMLSEQETMLVRMLCFRAQNEQKALLDSAAQFIYQNDFDRVIQQMS